MLLASLLVGGLQMDRIVAELERVLQEKFPQAHAAISDTLEAFKNIAIFTVPSEIISVIIDDPDDNRVLECAVSARADTIISGDRHLLSLNTFRSIPIIPPQAFLTRLRPTTR